MRPTQRHPAALAVVVSLVTSLVVGAGTLAWASHQWSDVPTGNAFHGDIDAFTDAGCGSGYANGTFRPTQPVLRQQAARFFRACGTRLANTDSDSSMSVATNPGTQLRTDTITAGAVGDGGGWVLALGTVEYFTSDTDSVDFPCSVVASITSDTHTGAEATGTVFRNAAPVSSFLSDSVTVMEVYAVDGGDVLTADLFSTKFDCGAGVTAEGDLSLLYVPFNGEGQGGG